ncbi:MAG: DEAD/DEAH box helicase [Treponemataceae bacterium]|nr:DEAD/DEAH box helicase [Treponemataceae bacterium]
MSDYSFSERWIPILAAKSISTPTAVQRQVIPQLQEGTHLLFESETGTGKTLAYLLPLLEKIDASDSHVQLVVVAPTHELCSQIKGEVQSVTDLRTALLIGGAPLKRQQDLLKEKPQVIIGGPVRLAELIHLKKLKVDQVKAIVFDEVDRLLAPELRDETCMLLGLMPEGRQVVACSATAKPKLAEILSEACNDKPVLKLEQLPKEDVLRKRISHWAIFAEERSKIDTLRRFLSAEKPAKALVFTARPDQAMNIVYKLQYKKVDCEVLHARQDKQERKAAIDRFRSGKTPVLVTSDLAARGLDFPGITHIIQMDVPTNDDFFVHRAGRTARSGLTGINVCIGDAHEMRTLRRLERRLELTVYPKMLHNGQVISPDQFMEAEDFEDEAENAAEEAVREPRREAAERRPQKVRPPRQEKRATEPKTAAATVQTEKKVRERKAPTVDENRPQWAPTVSQRKHKK